MSILSAFSSGMLAATGAEAEVMAGGGDRYFGEWGSSSAAGMRVTPWAAKRLPTFLACVAKRATTMAMLPCKIMSDGPKGAKVATNHPIYDLLYSRPNHIQSAYEFKWMMEAHLSMRNNAYAEIIPGSRGPFGQLMPMHPDRVRVEQLMSSGRLRYRYQDPLTNTERVLMQEEVFHLRDMPDSVGVGQDRISMMCDTLGLAMQRQEYTARFMRNDATPGGIVTGVKFATVEAEDTFVDSLIRARTGKNAGRPYMLPPGADMKSLGFTPVQAQLIEASKLSDTQICSAMGVLPHTVGVDAGKAATFASTEQFNLMDVQQRVLPQAILWEQAIQRCLITSARYYAKFGVASLMRGDAASRAEFYTAMATIGWMCADEGRALEDMSPIPGGKGKIFWNPLNWGRIDRQPPVTLALAPPAPDDTEDDDDEEEEETDPPTNDDEEDEDEEQARAIVAELGTSLILHTRYRANEGAR